VGTPAAPIDLSFALAAVRALPLGGASGVTGSAAGVLLVEDDLGIYRLRGSAATLWAGPALHEALGDLEGITASEDGRRVWALSEEGGTLVELGVGRRGPVVVRTGRLTRPGSKKNKGFEGLAFVAARLSPTGRDALIAVHEHKPRRVCVFDARTLQQTHDLKLPPAAKAALDDLADVAVDPRTGRLVLLSEESRRLAVVRVAAGGLELERTFDLPLTGGERPEGLAFLSPSRLAVVTEGPARLLLLRVGRRRRPG
jgi:uncharacterized protein YjiK